jgi:hypothetical protein
LKVNQKRITQSNKFLFQIVLIIENVFEHLSSGPLLARREVVAKEIFDTEENYVRSLEEIVKVFNIYSLSLSLSLSLSRNLNLSISQFLSVLQYRLIIFVGLRCI